ncbi:MAG: S9 family peptidase [Bacteroidetes bacterium]|nr:S9 family peptidase [Bacteroidota bacterium]
MLFVLLSTIAFGQTEEDPNMWLEEVNGERSLEWVRTQNTATTTVLEQHPEFQSIKSKILTILNSNERIAYPRIKGTYVYNFWQDETHPRGIWRRTLLKDYVAGTPSWETMLDLDALSIEEGEKWAFKGAEFLYPDYDVCLLHLSRGGSDAVEIREFDLNEKKFVDYGFYVEDAKTSIAWIDRDNVLVSSSLGDGMATNSGYARETKLWNRKKSLSTAMTLFGGEPTDVAVSGFVQNTPERQYAMVSRAVTFFTSKVYVIEGKDFFKLDIPEDAQFHGFLKNQMLVELKSNWSVGGNAYAQGSLLAIDYDAFRKGTKNFNVLFVPDERSSLASVSTTKNLLLLETLTNVSSTLLRGTLENGTWRFEKVATPENGTISIVSTDELSDSYFFSFENFLQPRTLYFVSGDDQSVTKVKSMPRFFRSEGLEVTQHEAVSTDGERIPYFVVTKKGLPLDGSHPTLLTAYGGFEVSQQPYYDAVTGVTWLEYGGVYVLANIRGGGEFGPRWHQAALKEKRQTAFDDFIAVSEDLIRRGITSPKHLGISGGSNGGLLVGVAFTQRPELYNAVVCAVPLLDMQRYNKLLAGASWMGEYGDPDIPEQWEYIKKYSPYHNLHAGKTYPAVLFTTTTHDDRVHPAHARKMAAKMAEQGHPFYYFENTEGGHGSGVTSEQRAYMMTVEAVYLLKLLR